MRDLVASEIRRLRRDITHLERRISLSNLTGKVVPGSQDKKKRTVQLEIGKSADGRVIKSPPVRWRQQGAGKLKIHAVPADNEQMTLNSPDGTIGSASLADWATYDKDHTPPSSEDEVVMEFGSAKLKMTDADASFAFGETTLKLSEAEASLTQSDKGVLVKDDEVRTTKDKTILNNGLRQAHFVGGRDSAGDIAVDGADVFI